MIKIETTSEPLAEDELGERSAKPLTKVLCGGAETEERKTEELMKALRPAGLPAGPGEAKTAYFDIDMSPPRKVAEIHPFPVIPLCHSGIEIGLILSDSTTSLILRSITLRRGVSIARLRVMSRNALGGRFGIRHHTWCRHTQVNSNCESNQIEKSQNRSYLRPCPRPHSRMKKNLPLS